MRPQVGQRIAAPFLSAPAEVKTFEPRAGYYRLEVVLDDGPSTWSSLSVTADNSGHDVSPELPHRRIPFLRIVTTKEFCPQWGDELTWLKRTGFRQR